jgi:hypothetical protein
MNLANLPTAWRGAANELRRFGAEPQARTLELCADELQQALLAARDELLTLRRAAEESGYSEDHLGRLIRTGKLANAGRRSRPLIRRSELPIKPGFSAKRDTKEPSNDYLIDRLFRDIIHSKTGGR